MNKYEKKAIEIQKHIIEHPTDYQSVVSFFVAQSDSIMYERTQKKNMMLKEVAKYKREGATLGK